MKGVNLKDENANITARNFLSYCKRYSKVEVTEKELELIMSSGLVPIEQDYFLFFAKGVVGDTTYFKDCKLVIVEPPSEILERKVSCKHEHTKVYRDPSSPTKIICSDCGKILRGD